MAVLGVVGLGKASLDLFHAFWDGLSPEQRQQLHAAAYEAGVNLNRLLSGSDDPRLDES
jgi:TRAP-type C4-dicarboxylate transport system substrate-binding protein